MKKAPDLPPAEIRRRASVWFMAQIEKLSAKHGDRWPEHEQWVREYLAQEIRSRLMQLGWRVTG